MLSVCLLLDWLKNFVKYYYESRKKNQCLTEQEIESITNKYLKLIWMKENESMIKKKHTEKTLTDTHFDAYKNVQNHWTQVMREWRW